MVVDPFHVVPSIPSAGKAVNIPGAIREIASEGFLSMAVHTVGFAFMAKLASRRGKNNRFALGKLASIRLEVRVQVLTIDERLELFINHCICFSLIIAFECFWRVVAVLRCLIWTLV